MRNYLSFLMLLLFAGGSITGAGIFDRIRERANRAVEEAVDEAIDTVGDKDESDSDQPAGEQTPQEQTPSQQTEAEEPIASEADLYGYWEGTVTPSGSGHSYMSGMTVYITLGPDFEGMRVSGAGTQCLAELEPTDTLGRYEAAFIDERQTCGSRATVSFASGGNVTINWDDMPNATDKTYTGKLTRQMQPRERTWSTDIEARNKLDIVGLRLGMTYEEARDYLAEAHPDLAQTLNFVKDAGTTSILLKLTQSDAKKAGPVVYGEQITLVFESQTPEEMEVEQDPAVQAAIEERQAIIEERQAIQPRQRANRRLRGRTARTPTVTEEAELPEIPALPTRRPAGAEAELVVITRQIQYPSRRGPHPDNIIAAMSDKYGEPSINLSKQGSSSGQIRLGWVYDKSGSAVADAKAARAICFR